MSGGAHVRPFLLSIEDAEIEAVAANRWAVDAAIEDLDEQWVFIPVHRPRKRRAWRPYALMAAVTVVYLGAVGTFLYWLLGVIR